MSHWWKEPTKFSFGLKQIPLQSQGDFNYHREGGDRNIHYLMESVSSLIDPKFLFKWHWLVLIGAGVGITSALSSGEEYLVKV